jgi:hypothetical protein
MLVAWCFDRYFSLLLDLHVQSGTMLWTCLLDSAHVRLLYTSGTCLYTSLACNSCFTRCKLAKSWSCRSDLLFSCNWWLSCVASANLFPLGLVLLLLSHLINSLEDVAWSLYALPMILRLPRDLTCCTFCWKLRDTLASPPDAQETLIPLLTFFIWFKANRGLHD